MEYRDFVLTLALGILLVFLWAFMNWIFTVIGKGIWDKVKVHNKSRKWRARIHRAETNENIGIIYFLLGVTISYLILSIIYVILA